MEIWGLPLGSPSRRLNGKAQPLLTIVSSPYLSDTEGPSAPPSPQFPEVLSLSALSLDVWLAVGWVQPGYASVRATSHSSEPRNIGPVLLTHADKWQPDRAAYIQLAVL